MIPKIEKSDVWNDSMEVHCPVCEFQNVHHESSVTIIDGQDDYKACKKVRGSVISIPMYCEQDHRFLLNFGFHKGTIRVWCDDLGNKYKK